jgi:hypothetical protein
MPLVLPSLVKFALGSFGAAAIVHWALREARRLNEEIERVKPAPTVDRFHKEALPTLRRDPSTGEWRVM